MIQKHTLISFLLWCFVPSIFGQDINLARGKNSLSSSNESTPFTSKEAFDGNLNTRWSSEFANSQWIQVDLESVLRIQAVVLHWEAAYAVQYEIQFSNNGSDWKTVYREETGNGQSDEIQIFNDSARYVRMFGIQRATPYGFSLFEMEVYGPGDSSDARLRKILIDQTEWSAFTSDRLNYDYVLPAGAAKRPEFTVETMHPEATYTIEHPASLPGTSLINVTSADLSERLTYRIKWIPSSYELLWSDEFDNDGKAYLEGRENAVDDEKWFHQTLLPNGNSWYNGEIQHYTDRITNAYVSDGSLKIVAKRENITQQGISKSFSSARLNSKAAFRVSKGEGKIEFRAKLPEGAGTWPAVWMLGQNINEPGAYWYTKGFGTTPWPACGEIDIMEHWGDNQNYVTSALHTPSSFGNTQNKGGQVIPTASSAFHVYSLQWTPEKMEFLVDGKLHYTYQPEVRNEFSWPFDVPQYLIMNIAIEADIDANGASFQESALEIDYIRVYERRVAALSGPDIPLKLRIFPNPAQHRLHLEAEQEISEVRILDVHGKEFFYAVPGEKRLVLDHSLSQGLYIAMICIEGRWIQQKFLVE